MIHLVVILNCVPSRKIIPDKESFDLYMEAKSPQTGYMCTHSPTIQNSHCFLKWQIVALWGHINNVVLSRKTFVFGHTNSGERVYFLQKDPKQNLLKCTVVIELLSSLLWWQYILIQKGLMWTPTGFIFGHRQQKQILNAWAISRLWLCFQYNLPYVVWSKWINYDNSEPFLEIHNCGKYHMCIIFNYSPFQSFSFSTHLQNSFFVH